MVLWTISKEPVCDFFINNCNLSSQFCSPLQEESGAQRGWGIPQAEY